jgi:hypothetical protein
MLMCFLIYELVGRFRHQMLVSGIAKTALTRTGGGGEGPGGGSTGDRHPRARLVPTWYFRLPLQALLSNKLIRWVGM